MSRRPPLFPPLAPRRVLLRWVALGVVSLGGTFAILVATLKTWPWFVVLAAALAYQSAVVRLYKWKWDDWPERTRGELFRNGALLALVVAAGAVVFWFTPGGFAAKIAAYGVYAAVLLALMLIARRVTDWKWLD